MPKQVVFTRAMVTVLDRWPDITMAEAGRQLGVSKATIHRWLSLLGAVHPREIPNEGRDRHEPRCCVCEILLSEAEAMDGKGSATTCRFCLVIAAGKPWGYEIFDKGLTLERMEGK